MATQQDIQQKINEARGLFADAPELAKVALENLIRNTSPEELATRTQGMESAGRLSYRQGNVSEFLLIIPLAKGGAKRLRSTLQLLHGNFQAADKIGTVHDMRWTFLDNDTKLLFATAYDGEWDAYIEDFATKVPDYLDALFSACEGYPGIRSPSIKDWVAKHQISPEGWYVANPNLTVVETKRLERIGKALEEFLDKIG